VFLYRRVLVGQLILSQYGYFNIRLLTSAVKNPVDFAGEPGSYILVAQCWAIIRICSACKRVVRNLVR